MSPERQRNARLNWRLVAAVSLGFAVVQLDVSVVNVAITPIGAALGGGVSGLQWVVSTYTITFAALILTAGALGDRIGARRVYVAGFVVFTVASLACGIAPSLGFLIGARAVQGIGAAALVPCSLMLLGNAHPDASTRGRAVGLWAAGASVALSGGPLVGGALITVVGWRAIFFINLPIGIVAIALTLRHAVETPAGASRSVDRLGQVAAVASLALLAGSVIEGGAKGFTAWPVLLGLGLAVIAGVAFLVIERRQRDPMLPLALFRIPAFRESALIGVLINVAFYGLIFVLSLFFQRAQGLSPLEAGLAFAPMTAVVLAANLIGGRVSAGARARPVLIFGAALLGAASLALLPTRPAASYGAIVVQLIAIGFGLGLIVPIITSILLGAVEPARSGVAAGTLNSARQTGSVIGVAIYGSVSAGGITNGLHVALLVSAAISLAVSLIAMLGRMHLPACAR